MCVSHLCVAVAHSSPRAGIWKRTSRRRVWGLHPTDQILLVPPPPRSLGLCFSVLTSYQSPSCVGQPPCRGAQREQGCPMLRRPSFSSCLGGPWRKEPGASEGCVPIGVRARARARVLCSLRHPHLHIYSSMYIYQFIYNNHLSITVCLSTSIIFLRQSSA